MTCILSISLCINEKKEAAATHGGVTAAIGLYVMWKLEIT